jgi:hypothetical protein
VPVRTEFVVESKEREPRFVRDSVFDLRVYRQLRHLSLGIDRIAMETELIE